MFCYGDGKITNTPRDIFTRVKPFFSLFTNWPLLPLCFYLNPHAPISILIAGMCGVLTMPSTDMFACAN